MTNAQLSAKVTPNRGASSPAKILDFFPAGAPSTRHGGGEKWRAIRSLSSAASRLRQSANPLLPGPSPRGCGCRPTIIPGRPMTQISYDRVIRMRRRLRYVAQSGRKPCGGADKTKADEWFPGQSCPPLTRAAFARQLNSTARRTTRNQSRPNRRLLEKSAPEERMGDTLAARHQLARRVATKGLPP